MAGLTSAKVPPPGPEDHLRGSGPVAVVYADFGCPHCAAVWNGLDELDLTICLRHFPVKAQHPRSPALHAVAEAAGQQDAFWPFADHLFHDRGHTDDPHLWKLAEELGLDVERLQRDRRSERVVERVERDFRAGVRAGVSATPAVFVDGEKVDGPLHRNLRSMLEA